MTFYCTECEKELIVSDQAWEELNCYEWCNCPFCGSDDFYDKEELEQEGYFNPPGYCGESSCMPCVQCKRIDR